MLVRFADVMVPKVVDVVDVFDVGRSTWVVGVRWLSVRDGAPVEFADSVVAEPVDVGRLIRADGIRSLSVRGRLVVVFADIMMCNLVDMGRSTGVFGRRSLWLRSLTAVRFADILVSKVVGAERFIAGVCKTAAGTRGAARPKTRRRWLQVFCIL